MNYYENLAGSLRTAKALIDGIQATTKSEAKNLRALSEPNAGDERTLRAEIAAIDSISSSLFKASNSLAFVLDELVLAMRAARSTGPERSAD